MELKIGYFGKLIIITRKVLRCVKEGLKRSVSWVVWKMKKYYTESRGKKLKRRRGERLKQLVGDLKDGRRYWSERGSTRSHSVENSLSRRIRTYRKRDYGLNEWMNEWINKRSVFSIPFISLPFFILCIRPTYLFSCFAGFNENKKINYIWHFLLTFLNLHFLLFFERSLITYRIL